MYHQVRRGRTALIPNSFWRSRVFSSICLNVFFIWGAFNSFEQLLSLVATRPTELSSPDIDPLPPTDGCGPCCQRYHQSFCPPILGFLDYCYINHNQSPCAYSPGCERYGLDILGRRVPGDQP